MDPSPTMQGFQISTLDYVAIGAYFAADGDSGKFNLGSTEFSWKSLYNTEPRTLWMFMAAMTLIWSRKYVSDQNMVQPYLLARSTKEAQRATLLGAALFGYYQLTGIDPPSVADKALPHFIVTQLPNGLVGLIIAAILAASMSSVSSGLNSVDTS